MAASTIAIAESRSLMLVDRCGPTGNDHGTRLRVMREALDAGERSGPSTVFDFDVFLAAAAARSACRLDDGSH
nr:type II toxin-antitoxin system ParD family antitoxin [Nocardia miyunensis]